MSKHLLYDEVRADIAHFQPDDLSSSALINVNEFARAIPFRIDNVADYYFETPKNDWSQDDFPNVAPPYPSFWLEYAMPEAINQSNIIIPNPVRGYRAGLWFRVCTEDKVADTEWDMECWLFIKRLTGPKDQACRWRIAVEKSGGIVVIGERSWEKHQEKDDNWYVAGWLYPGLLALSFLHCKNVDLIENIPPKLPMTKKRAQHPPRTKFYTLNIKPMQRILEDEGHASQTGLKLALHICRGHFKDFSKGGGLFGKYHGMYWWDSQVRGSKEHGEVKKDYRVKPPTQPVDN